MGRRNRRLRRGPRPLLYVSQILEWADEHRQRTGKWPTHQSGDIPGTVDETWMNVDSGLRQGLRGLRPGSSLSRLLAAHREHRNRRALPPLRIGKILQWADAYHQRTGEWPKKDSGPVLEAPGETWGAVDTALQSGIRNLPGGSSLPRLLETRRGLRNPQNLPHLTVAKVLAWADAHHERTGRWPTAKAGAIHDAPGETWCGVDSAFWHCKRGVKSKMSLAQFLAQHRGVRNEKDLPNLTVPRILRWADAHHRRTGKWPLRSSGPILDAPGERWSAVAANLHVGGRGLPPGSSLARLLAEHRGVRNRKDSPLTITQVMAWANAHRLRSGRWPTKTSGPIPESPGDTWNAVNGALAIGGRGLPGDLSLAKIFI